MNLRMESLLDLRLEAGELDYGAAVGNAIDLETVVLEPSGDELKVLVRRAELQAELVGCEPFVVVGRGFVLLIVEKLVQGELLLRIALEDQQHALHWQIRRCRANIELWLSQRMRVASQRDNLSFVNWLGD